jgi:hypothetical protein
MLLEEVLVWDVVTQEVVSGKAAILEGVCASLCTSACANVEDSVY